MGHGHEHVAGLDHGHGNIENISVDWDSIKWDELSPEEKWNYEHLRMHQKHQGHANMHAEMILILFAVLVVSQIALVQWRKWKPYSYHLCTLIGMWVIPVGLSIRSLWWRFPLIWLIFSSITSIIIKKSLEKPIQRNTPRLVYKWFLLIYKISYCVGIFGYLTMMATFLGFNLIFGIKPSTWMDTGLLAMFYALYYGVMARDFAEICTEKMAANIGYHKEEGMPERHLEHDTCAVCANKLLVAAGEDGVIENTYKLTCGHEFHEFCIRGWCIVGKKQTCPYCHEKVDLKRMFPTPWEKPHVMYGQLLDWLRWLVCWQPVILLLVQGINWALGLE